MNLEKTNQRNFHQSKGLIKLLIPLLLTGACQKTQTHEEIPKPTTTPKQTHYSIPTPLNILRYAHQSISFWEIGNTGDIAIASQIQNSRELTIVRNNENVISGIWNITEPFKLFKGPAYTPQDTIYTNENYLNNLFPR